MNCICDLRFGTTKINNEVKKEDCDYGVFWAN
jgi:hypothetical protein